jgi:hypothetical protein
MSAHCIYPGEYFILKRDAGRVGWELLYRDDSVSTMDLRYNYQAERLKPGEGLRYERPDGTVMAEVEK